MLAPQQQINDPLVLAVQYQMGNLKAVYKPSTMCRVVAFVFLLLLGGMIIIGSLIFVQAFSSIFPLIFTLVGFMLLLLGIFGLINAYRNHTLRFFLYEHGFIQSKREALDVVLWQNVQVVWHKVVVTTSTSTGANGVSSTSTSITHYYTVQCFDGRRLEIDRAFARMHQLGKSLELETAPYLFPEAFNAYQRDHGFAFGSILVTPQGISHGPNRLSWEEVKSLKVDERQGFIVVRKAGKFFRWASIKLETVPNVEVFRLLVHQITGWWIDVTR